MQNLSAFLKVY